MTYNPHDPLHRGELAAALLDMLEKAGFVETKTGGRERVFARPLPEPGVISVMVYTTIERSEVRDLARDAIRVSGVYQSKNGKSRGVVKLARVHRTGEIEGVVSRTLDRMREAWSLTKKTERCGRCGAPLFKSRKDNLVCSDVCWKE